MFHQIYVTGKSFGNSFDCVTLKYNPCGDLKWTNRYNYYDYDRGWDLIVNNQNQLLVTGETYTGYYYKEQYLTLKYNLSGTQIWDKIGGGTDDDVGKKIAFDNDGNIYVAGYSCESDHKLNYMLVKLDQNSNVIWSRYYGVSGYDDEINDMTVDQYGNIYVTGYSYSATNNSWDWATLKYDANGNLLWNPPPRYNGSANGGDVAFSLVVDNTGNVYVTGVTWEYEIPPGEGGDAGQNTFTTIKYYLYGNQQWFSRYFGGGILHYARGNSITLSNNEPVATGHVHEFDTEQDKINDFVTIKYNVLNGNKEWTTIYGYTPYGIDYGVDVKTDYNGDIYVTGRSESIAYFENSLDIATIKYNPLGYVQWIMRYNGPDDKKDFPSELILDNYEVYVTGTSDANNGTYDYITIKYAPDWLPTDCDEQKDTDANNSGLKCLVRVNDSCAFAVGESGAVRKTTNSGLNWTSINVQATCRFNDVRFNNTIGLIVGDSGIALRSSNFGKNWTIIQLPTIKEIKSVSFSDVSTIWCAGVRGGLFKSSDYGTTWANRSLDSLYDLNSIYFVNSSFGFICGTYGKILATSNGGINWYILNSNNSNQLNKISFFDAKSGIIVGNSGTVLLTADGGLTWLKTETEHSNDLNDVCILPNGTVYIVGNTGVMLRSSNSGINWTTENTQTNSDLIAVAFLDSNKGMAAGTDGNVILTCRGEVYYNEGGDYSTINDVLEYSVNNAGYQLSQNYPNPFNPETKISFYVPKYSKVKINVYDVTGRLITELLNDYRAKGTHSVCFNGFNLSSGVYFYKLTAYDSNNNNQLFSTTKKMVILK